MSQDTRREAAERAEIVAFEPGLRGEPVGVHIPGYLDGRHRPIRQIGLEVV